MNNHKSKFWRILFSGAIIFILAVNFNLFAVKAQTKDEYKVLEIKTQIGEGRDQEIKVLFEKERRKIAQLILRNGKKLESHSVEEPILIQCIAGSGELLIQNKDINENIELLPGTFVTVDGNIVHDIIGKPSVSIILTRFLE